MRWLRACSLVVIFLLIAAAVLVKWLWNSPVELPAPVASLLKEKVRHETGALLEYDSLKLNGATGEGMVLKATLKNASTTSIVAAGQVQVKLGSGTSIVDIISGNTAIDEISASDIDVDLQKISQILKNLQSDSSPSTIPVDKLFLKNVRIATGFGKFLIDSADVKLRRVSGDMTGMIHAAELPFGGSASVSFRIPFDYGTGTVALDWTGANIPKTASIYPLLWFWGISIDNGSADISLQWSGNVKDRLSELDSNPAQLFRREVRGSVGLRDLVVSWNGLQSTFDASLQSKDPSGSWNCAIDGRSGSETASVNINLDGSGQEWGIGASGTVDLASRAWSVIQQFKPLPDSVKPGSTRLDFQVRKPAGRIWQADIDAEVQGWSVASVPVDRALVKATTTGAALHFSGAVESETGKAVSSGIYDSATNIVDANIQLNALPSGLFKFIPAELHGAISGEFNLRGNVSAVASSSVNGHLVIENPIWQKRRAARLEAGLSVESGMWIFSDPILEFAPGSRIAFNGIVSKARIDGEATGNDVSAEFLGLEPDAVAGNCSFRLDVSGSPDSPSCEGELWAQNIVMWGRDTRILRSRISGNRRLLSLDQLRAEITSGGVLEGYLGFDFKKDKISSVRLDIISADISSFADLIPETLAETAPSGILNASFEKIPSKDDAAWRFAIESSRITIASVPVEGVAVDGVWLDHRLDHLSVTAGIGNGKFSLSGHQLVSDGYAGDVALHDVDLSRLEAAIHLKSPLRGILTADGSIVWNDTSPSGRLTVVARDLGIGDRFLGNGGGELLIDRSGVTMNKAAFDRMGLQLSGKVTFETGNPYTLQCSMKRTDLSAFPAAYGFRSFQKGDLLVTGVCAAEGRADRVQPDRVNASIQSLEIRRGKDLIVANRPMQFLYQNGIVELRSFELKYRQGIFGAEGTWDPRGRTALTLSGRDFSIHALGNLLEIPDWMVDGSLSFDGGVVGTFPEIRLDARVSIKDLEYRDRKIPEMSGEIELTQERLKLESVIVKLRHTSLGLSGVVPLPESSSPNSMDMNIEIASGPISDLPLMLPELFNTAQGNMKASLRLFGRPRAPAVSGTLNLTADQLGLKGMRQPFKQVSIGLLTNDGVIRISPFRATMGHGILEGGGEVDFQGGNGSVSARLSGQKLDLSWNGIDITGASATVDLGGTLYRPVVRGSVKIPKGRAQIGEMKSTPKLKIPLPLESLDYRFDVEIPRNFWVKNSFLNAEMRGSFSAFGDLDRFKMSGTIQSVQGWLFFQRRKFQLESGEIKFGGQDDKIDPHLYIKSVTNVQNTQIYLTLEGRVSSFTPRLHSSPPLAESDLIALLTIGRSMEQARQTDTKDLFEKEILEGLKNTYLSGLLGSTLSTAFNLDEVFFGSLFDRNTGITRSFLRVGKYLGRNIFIAYEGTLSNEGEKTYIFEYRLPRGFVINIEVEKPRNRTRFGVKYDWKF